MNQTLTMTGVYTILAHANNYANTGSYGLSLTVFGGCTSLTLDFAVGRTQQDLCLPLEIVGSSPVALVSFSVEAPAGVLTSPTVALAPPFTNATVTQVSGSQWTVTMQATNGVFGDQIIGSICFTANAIQSEFVQVMLGNLVVNNQDATVPGTIALGGEAVIIANQSLLRAQSSTNGQRSVTLYGKANTDYVIDYSTNLSGNWFPGWTNTEPGLMFLASPVQGVVSNAPVLFLRAREN
jgi:hypothetical protein